ncbi:uncharacterized protein LOC124718685 [Schistocerca piceifrons]|uniref:uncharacterized protein LOC124718685 n=1 Tax=Schistocerca piceifrons TaxID=274613 RepID=UPI001F5F761B|nr:uncharacterized protein LOC124718685 [Schistocerca piceifrons]
MLLSGCSPKISHPAARRSIKILSEWFTKNNFIGLVAEEILSRKILHFSENCKPHYRRRRPLQRCELDVKLRIKDPQNHRKWAPHQEVANNVLKLVNTQLERGKIHLNLSHMRLMTMWGTLTSNLLQRNNFY